MNKSGQSYHSSVNLPYASPYHVKTSPGGKVEAGHSVFTPVKGRSSSVPSPTWWDYAKSGIGGVAGAMAGSLHNYFESVGQGNLPIPSAVGGLPPRQGADLMQGAENVANGAKIGWRVGKDPDNANFAMSQLNKETADMARGLVPSVAWLATLGNDKVVNAANRLMDKTPSGKWSQTANAISEGERDKYLSRVYGPDYKNIRVDDPDGEEIRNMDLAMHLGGGALRAASFAKLLGPVLGKAEAYVQKISPNIIGKVAPKVMEYSALGAASLSGESFGRKLEDGVELAKKTLAEQRAEIQNNVRSAYQLGRPTMMDSLSTLKKRRKLLMEAYDLTTDEAERQEIYDAMRANEGRIMDREREGEWDMSGRPQ